MSLKGIPLVDDIWDGSQKFILALIQGEKGEQIKVVRGSGDLRSHHRHLVEALYYFVRHRAPSKIEILGGGRIVVNKEKKTIVISGASGDYGQADHRKVQTILKKPTLNILLA